MFADEHELLVALFDGHNETEHVAVDRITWSRQIKRTWVATIDLY